MTWTKIDALIQWFLGQTELLQIKNREGIEPFLILISSACKNYSVMPYTCSRDSGIETVIYDPITPKNDAVY